MPALVPTDHHATITWLGVVPHRDDETIVEGQPLGEMRLDFGGMAGEVHAGRTRPSCSRVTSQHPKGTEIANVRQVSVVSAEELAEIAAEMGLDRIDPAWLGASIVVEGIADFSHIPPSARLQGPDGTTLVIDMVNHPCHIVSKTVKQAAGPTSTAFKTAAQGRRGVTAWVERPGTLALGQSLRLHVPSQRPWQGG